MDQVPISLQLIGTWFCGVEEYVFNYKYFLEGRCSAVYILQLNGFSFSNVIILGILGAMMRSRYVKSLFMC